MTPGCTAQLGKHIACMLATSIMVLPFTCHRQTRGQYQARVACCGPPCPRTSAGGSSESRLKGTPGLSRESQGDDGPGRARNGPAAGHTARGRLGTGTSEPESESGPSSGGPEVPVP
jgi:hypothetical protein